LAARIRLPAGALDGDNAILTVVSNPALPAPVPSGVQDLGLSLDLSLSNGQTVLAGGQSAALAISYQDLNNDGIVDGTDLRVQSLKLYVYDAATGAWAKLATNVDEGSRLATGNTTHFSFFAVFGVLVAVNLDSVIIYPAPFKPYGPNPDEGRPYSPGNPNSGIIFDNLPEAATIRIYTASGQSVAEHIAANGAGKVQWDARNKDGRELASGGYLAVISSPGHKTVVKKISIIR